MIEVKNKCHLNDKPQNNVVRIYIGRGSILGNPFTYIKNRKTKAKYFCENREQSIHNFEKYLRAKIKNKNQKVCDELNKIWLLSKDKKIELICFCKPKKCHGDIIKKIIEENE